MIAMTDEVVRVMILTLDALTRVAGGECKNFVKIVMRNIFRRDASPPRRDDRYGRDDRGGYGRGGYDRRGKTFIE